MEESPGTYCWKDPCTHAATEWLCSDLSAMFGMLTHKYDNCDPVHHNGGKVKLLKELLLSCLHAKHAESVSLGGAAQSRQTHRVRRAKF
jgi:hypothetical protein